MPCLAARMAHTFIKGQPRKCGERKEKNVAISRSIKLIEYKRRQRDFTEDTRAVGCVIDLDECGRILHGIEKSLCVPIRFNPFSTVEWVPTPFNPFSTVEV